MGTGCVQCVVRTILFKKYVTNGKFTTLLISSAGGQKEKKKKKSVTVIQKTY